MSDKELEKELKKMSQQLKSLADSWEKTGMPTNIEEATEKIEKFIKWVEKNRPDVKKKREELLRRFPHLKNVEVLEY